MLAPTTRTCSYAYSYFRSSVASLHTHNWKLVTVTRRSGSRNAHNYLVTSSYSNFTAIQELLQYSPLTLQAAARHRASTPSLLGEANRNQRNEFGPGAWFHKKNPGRAQGDNEYFVREPQSP